MRNTILLVCLICISLVILARQAESKLLDPKTLLHDLAFLASDEMEGRQVGSEGSQKARRYLKKRLKEIGVTGWENKFFHPFTLSYAFGHRQGPIITKGHNVLGLISGTAFQDSFIVLSAHYDHLGVRKGKIFNGADDNASGTAALLAIAEYFIKYPPRYSLIIAAFDAEEIGLKGAKAFLEEMRGCKDGIILNLNMDMISRNDDNEIYVSGTYHSPQLKSPIARLATQHHGIKVLLGHDNPKNKEKTDWTTSSDHGPFHEAGIPFLYFGVEDHEDYHEETDVYERIHPDFYVSVVNYIIKLIKEVDKGI